MCIENTAEAAMVTKDQEREALQQIKALVADLGPNSYIATAFRGVFDIAEENIENDFSGNPEEYKARAEAAEAQLVILKAKLYDYMTTQEEGRDSL